MKSALKSVIILFLSVVHTLVFAQKAAEYESYINQDNLRTYLTILASDSLEGRETGKKGQKMAADYIKSHFEHIGLQPVVATEEGELSYYQPIVLEEISQGETYLETANMRYENLEDVLFLGNASIEEPTSYELIFIGQGAVDEFSSADVEGKVAVIYNENNRLMRELSARAIDAGAMGLLIVNKSKDEEFQRSVAMYKNWLSRPRLTFPEEVKEGVQNRSNAFFVGPNFLKDAFALSEDFFELNKEVDEMKASLKGKTAEVTFYVTKDVVPINTENVLGFLEGTDKKDEILVITSHYDHLGIIDGEIYNGADDDGSGTAGVMAIAEAFAQAAAAGDRPRRSILFMPVTGEEKGLLGSQYYTDNPVFPLEQTVANLNIDMIGRIDTDYVDDPDYIYLIGSDKLSTELHELGEEANRNSVNLKLDYRYNDENDPNRFYYRSDHYNFAKNNIPVIFYFNGVHADYHQPTDTVDKIHFGKMEKISRLIFHTAWEIANRENRLEVDKID
ncbi:MAG: M28 family metallopeptidase [Cyclobacteriaceae bacterium]|nr:M28 family peptidase [Cyclobacteriaceae bacterium]MCH8516550.1 M28 family metallopeptidase [Cyclobacteriaceae bacterium]